MDSMEYSIPGKKAWSTLRGAPRRCFWPSNEAGEAYRGKRHEEGQHGQREGVKHATRCHVDACAWVFRQTRTSSSARPGQ